MKCSGAIPSPAVIYTRTVARSPASASVSLLAVPRISVGAEPKCVTLWRSTTRDMRDQSG